MILKIAGVVLFSLIGWAAVESAAWRIANKMELGR